MKGRYCPATVRRHSHALEPLPAQAGGKAQVLSASSSQDTSRRNNLSRERNIHDTARPSAYSPKTSLSIHTRLTRSVGGPCRLQPRHPGSSGSGTAPENRIPGTAVTEILFAIGAGDRVVGISDFDTYPPEALNRPRVGALIDPNVETILALQPDLVIAYGTQSLLRERLAVEGFASFRSSPARPSATFWIRFVPWGGNSDCKKTATGWLRRFRTHWIDCVKPAQPTRQRSCWHITGTSERWVRSTARAPIRTMES